MLPARGRFVLLMHLVGEKSDRPDHWDLMLENGPTLFTLELQTLPVPNRGYWCLRLPDHRHYYLEYEGELSDGRGSVKRIAAGFYSSTHTSTTCDIVLHSEKIEAELRIVLNQGKVPPVGSQAWMQILDLEEPAIGRDGHFPGN